MDTVLFLGAWLFAATQLDTLVVISAFCADNDYRIREVFLGHYVGFSIGLTGAVLGALIAGEILSNWTFLLGVVPLSIGLWGLISRPPETVVEESAVVPNTTGRIGVVAMTGIGMSGDNMAVFVPFFADLSPEALVLIIGAYLIGAGIVFLVALLVVYHVAIDGISDRLDRWLVPAVLVAVGCYVILAGLIAA
ncbi:cadmium resistance transporter [Natranaeroarchaeum sulfidigenes]|uniref:Cadmium resistance protein CadD, predicted permease n=1 Tax=Natranaeroarchaeum sulfidigenes TaxID=2784880 RepID=A0A897MM35_9EURY|nr:cadmium resistance transporter [Natranaeroarchaeum sulfidigenes]QSG01667.1 Cadmium resistance protein CadD, predicted permease [Natranaeroarchaeum sulfidigenes]